MAALIQACFHISTITNRSDVHHPDVNLWRSLLSAMSDKLRMAAQVSVAVIREEGSNGDREMAAAVYAAGMQPWDVTMSDLLQGRAALDSFQGMLLLSGSNISTSQYNLHTIVVFGPWPLIFSHCHMGSVIE